MREGASDWVLVGLGGWSKFSRPLNSTFQLPEWHVLIVRRTPSVIYFYSRVTIYFRRPNDCMKLTMTVVNLECFSLRTRVFVVGFCRNSLFAGFNISKSSIYSYKSELFIHLKKSTRNDLQILVSCLVTSEMDCEAIITVPRVHYITFWFRSRYLELFFFSTFIWYY